MRYKCECGTVLRSPSLCSVVRSIPQGAVPMLRKRAQTLRTRIEFSMQELKEMQQDLETLEEMLDLIQKSTPVDETQAKTQDKTPA